MATPREKTEALQVSDDESKTMPTIALAADMRWSVAAWIDAGAPAPVLGVSVVALVLTVTAAFGGG